MVGHDQVRVLGDEEVAVEGGPPLDERLHLLDEGGRMDHHPAADHAAAARVKDAGGNGVEHVLLASHHHGVAGVVAALVAHHHVDVRRDDVDDLALALVAPLRADHHDVRHRPLRPELLEVTSGLAQHLAHVQLSLAPAGQLEIEQPAGTGARAAHHQHPAHALGARVGQRVVEPAGDDVARDRGTEVAQPTGQRERCRLLGGEVDDEEVGPARASTATPCASMTARRPPTSKANPTAGQSKPKRPSI